MVGLDTQRKNIDLIMVEDKDTNVPIEQLTAVITGKTGFLDTPGCFSRLERQLVFIAEMDKLKNVFRRTLITDSTRRENDAEHSWHIALMAVLLEEYAAEPVNMERVLKMLVIHDLVEVYAGDTFAFDVEGNKGKEERESRAAEKLFGLLPEDQSKTLRSLWEEFDRMDSADSKFAASLDRVQPFIHNALTNGHTWKLGNVTKEQVYERLSPVKEGTPGIWPWVENQIQLNVEKGWIRD